MQEGGGGEAETKGESFNLFSSELQDARDHLMEIGLLEGARGFRNDLEEIYVEEGENTYDSEEKNEVKRVGLRELRNTGEALRLIDHGVRYVQMIEVAGVGILFAMTFFTLQLPNLGLSDQIELGLSFGFSILIWLIGRGTMYGKATVESLGYKRFSSRFSDERLHFRASWNKSVLQSPWTFLGVIFVGAIYSAKSTWYNYAKQQIREEVQEKSGSD